MNKLMITLILVLVLALVACGGDDTESIVGTTWQWQAFLDMADENNITVSNPENYTLTLMDDGTANIQADCNQVTWTYELDGSALKFDTLGPSTLAFCGEDSLDTQYLQRLGDTATYILSDGQLSLNLIYDSGDMIFNP